MIPQGGIPKIRWSAPKDKLIIQYSENKGNLETMPPAHLRKYKILTQK